jgi:hypothetical protein
MGQKYHVKNNSHTSEPNEFGRFNFKKDKGILNKNKNLHIYLVISMHKFQRTFLQLVDKEIYIEFLLHVEFR